MEARRGDIVRSVDPFKIGEEVQRPWLIVNNSSHPFAEEQYVAVAISTKEYTDSIPLESEVWETGGVPVDSYISPWAIHSPRSEDLVAWQGRVERSFVDQVVETVVSYLE